MPGDASDPARGRFDAVVVGAGPAGSIAALVLARSGARVALADKAAFPRDKACGDLVGPRGVQILADLGLRVPDAGQGSDLLAVGPSGRRSRLPAFAGSSYPGHGIIVPRLVLDHALREAAVAAGAVPVRARITGVETGRGGRVDAARLVALLGQRGDLSADAQPGPVMGGWLRMGGAGAPPAAGNVLLAGDAAGLINPLQGEGIGPAMVSARLAAEAGLAGPARAGHAYAEAIEAALGRYMAGASAVQSVLLRRPRTASAATRLLTAPVVRRVVAGTWSIYWNGLVDGARPRPSAWAARSVEILAGHLA